MLRTPSGSTPGTLLGQIESASPFGGLGRISPAIRSALLGLDDEARARAVTILLRHAATLPRAAAVGAAETIDDLLAAGPLERLRRGLEPAPLVAIYAAISRDASRRTLTDLVVRLLRLLEPERVLGVVGVDARGLDLRARLSAELSEVAMAPPDDILSHRRGTDFDQFDAGGSPDEAADGGPTANSGGGHHPKPPTFAEPPEAAAPPPPPLGPGWRTETADVGRRRHLPVVGHE